MNQLDFLIIGAARTGTTTVFNLLRQHPDIYMPETKEAPINNMPIDEYMATYFSKTEGKIFGTVTPQYMEHSGWANILHDLWPDAKIIALLRHPVERAYSHYRQARRRGNESQSFHEAYTRPGSPYRLRSQYGCILEPYWKLFSHAMVFYSQDLENDPVEFMDRLHKFLGVAPYQAESEHAFHNIGSDTPGIFNRLQLFLDRTRLFKLMGSTLRRKLWWRLEMADRTGSSREEVAFDASQYLDDKLRHDAQLISDLTGTTPYWMH